MWEEKIHWEERNLSCRLPCERGYIDIVDYLDCKTFKLILIAPNQEVGFRFKLHVFHENVEVIGMLLAMPDIEVNKKSQNGASALAIAYAKREEKMRDIMISDLWGIGMKCYCISSKQGREI